MRHHRDRKDGGVPLFVDPAFAEALGGSRNESRRDNRKHEHKARQLCRQVQHALNLSLAGECGDDVLRELYVADVTPASDAGHLLVHVAMPRHVNVPQALESLQHATALLRVHVARAITRKRAPELTFVPAVAASGYDAEEGEVRP